MKTKFLPFVSCSWISPTIIAVAVSVNPFSAESEVKKWLTHGINEIIFKGFTLVKYILK